MKVSIVIPSQDEGLWIKNTVDSVLQNTVYPDYELMVVDDASEDGSCDNLPCRVIKNTTGENGPSRARQLGFDASMGDAIVMLDAHMCFEKFWLTRLVETHKQFPRAFLQTVCTTTSSMQDIKTVEVESHDFHTIRKEIKPLLAEATLPTVLELPKGIGGQVDIFMQIRQKLDTSVTTGDIRYPLLHYKSPQYFENEDDKLMFGAYIGLARDLLSGCFGWNYLYTRENQPKKRLIRNTALLGACYFFPRDLFLETFLGYLQLSGFIYEEGYFNIASFLQKIPIYCVTDTRVAHNFNKAHKGPRTQGETQNLSPENRKILADRMTSMLRAREVTAHICFDTMEEKIISKALGKSRWEHFPAWAEEYRENIQVKRLYSDEEFLNLNGLVKEGR